MKDKNEKDYSNTDITESKNIGDKLKKKEFYETLFKTVQIIILVMDSKGRIIELNPYAENLFGYSLGEIKGKDWFDTFLPKKDRAKMRALFLQAVSGNETKGNVNPVISKDGHEIIIEWYDKVLKDDNGRFIGLLSVGQDFTEQKKVENALRESQSTLSLITENTRDLIAITTLDMRATFKYVSPSYSKLLGYSKEELLGTSGLDFIHPKDKKKLMPLLLKYITGQAQGIFTGNSKDIFENIEYRVSAKSGEWLTMEAIVSLVEGQLIYVSRDITKRKKLEEEAQKRLHEMEIFYKASVGREERILELKKKVTELEEKLKK